MEKVKYLKTLQQEVELIGCKAVNWMTYECTEIDMKFIAQMFLFRFSRYPTKEEWGFVDKELHGIE